MMLNWISPRPPPLVLVIGLKFNQLTSGWNWDRSTIFSLHLLYRAMSNMAYMFGSRDGPSLATVSWPVSASPWCPALSSPPTTSWSTSYTWVCPTCCWSGRASRWSSTPASAGTGDLTTLLGKITQSPHFIFFNLIFFYSWFNQMEFYQTSQFDKKFK